LRQAVQAADKVAVKSALARDPEIIKDLVQAADEDGTTLLHICARNSAKRGASKIAYMLIDCMAQVDVEDAAGQTPLAVAISTSLSCKASCLARCLRTVTEILVAGKSSGVMWTIQKACGSAASEVAKVVRSPGNKLVDLMHIFGVDLAAFHEEERIQQRCSKLGIPFELIGAASASRLLNAHTDWQRMIVRKLRAECELQKLTMYDCVEKQDIVMRLLKAGIYKEKEAAKGNKFVGTWSYGKDHKKYHIIRTRDKELYIDLPHQTHGEVCGVLEEQDDGSL